MSSKVQPLPPQVRRGRLRGRRQDGNPLRSPSKRRLLRSRAEQARPANGDPAPAVPPAPPKADGETDHKVDRTQYTKRRALFVPLGCKGLPQDKDQYTGLRRTIGDYDNGEHFSIDENWLTHDNPTRLLERKWTGMTIFFLKGPVDGGAAPPPPPAPPPDRPIPEGKPAWKAAKDEITTDASGQRWKGDTLGRWFRIDEAGDRVRASERVPGYVSEVWNAMSYADQKKAKEKYELRQRELREAKS